jgi:hypothetical protein
MCDYSLQFVESRPAKLNDRLVCKDFANTATRGFAAVDDPEVAVCLSPGTELAFESNVQYGGLFGFGRRSAPAVARFCQVDTHDPNAHHDSLQFPDGRVVSFQKLRRGQIATVLQLPREPAGHHGASGATSKPAEPVPALSD